MVCSAPLVGVSCLGMREHDLSSVETCYIYTWSLPYAHANGRGHDDDDDDDHVDDDDDEDDDDDDVFCLHENNVAYTLHYVCYADSLLMI